MAGSSPGSSGFSGRKKKGEKKCKPDEESLGRKKKMS